MNELNLEINESDDKNIQSISNILENITNKNKEIKFYINSNCENFFETLKNKIFKANDNVQNNFNLTECFVYYNEILNRDINLNNTQGHKNLQKISDKIIEKLKNLESNYRLEPIFDKYCQEIDNIFQEIENNKSDLITHYEKNIEKLIENELKKKSKL